MRLCILLLVICVCFEASSASRLGRLFGSALAVHRKGKKEGAAKKGDVQRTSKAKTVALKKLKETAALSEQKVKIDVVDVPVVEDASSALKTAKKQGSLIGRQQTVLSIARMILSRFVFKINYKDPKTLVYARVTFVAYLVLFQALLWFLNQQVSKRDDSTILHKNPGSGVQSLISKLGGLAGQGAMTNTLLNLASLGGSASDKDKITVKSHDLKQIKELTSTLYFELFTTSLMHFVFGFQVPVLMTPVLGLCKLVQHPLVLLHLFRFRPVGQLERPFKTGFESFINTLSSPTTTTAPDANTASETPFPDLSGAASASGEQSAEDTSGHEETETESADQSTEDDVTVEEEEAEVPPSAHAADGEATHSEDNGVEDNSSVDVESAVVDADEVDEVESSGKVSEEEDEGDEEESSEDTEEEEEDGVQATEGGEEVDTSDEVEEDAVNSAEDTDEAEDGEEESEEVAEEDDAEEGEGSDEGEEPETEEEEQEGVDDDDNEVEEEEDDVEEAEEDDEEDEVNDEVNDEEEEEDSELMDAIDHLGE